MPMNTSGPISLGGTTVGQSINLEVGAPATSTVSLNDVIVRQLAGVLSGQIVIPTDFYGKSLAQAWFSQYTYSSPTINYQPNLVAFDNTGVYVRAFVAPAFTQGFLTRISGDDGSVVYNNQYVFGPPANPPGTASVIRNSVFDPSKLICLFTQQNGAPGPGSSSGPLPLYLNKSNGTVSSISPTRFFGISPSQITGGSSPNFIIDAPNGNILMGYSTPPGAGTMLALNQSFSVLSQFSVPAHGGVNQRSFDRVDNYTGDTIDWFRQGNAPSEPASGSRLTWGHYNLSALNFPINVQYGPMTPTMGSIAGSVTPTTRHYGNSGGSPSPASPTAPRSIWQVNRANGNINVARTTPATGGFAFPFSFTSRNGNPANEIAIKTSQGGNRLRVWDSNLNNTKTWNITGSAGVDIIDGFFANGFYYGIVNFTYSLPAKFWILKIKDDFSSIASGLTATVSGFTLTLTPNNAANLTSFDAPFTSPFNPYSTAGPTGYTTTANNPLTVNPISSLVTGTKVNI